VPFNIHFAAKKELKKMPFVGWYMMLTKMIFIDRSNRNKAYESLKKAGELIRKGKSVITFPEGTRAGGESITLFKQGSFQLALEAQVPIIPVRIKGAEKVWPAQSMKFIPGEVKIIYGEPILPATYKNMEVKELANFVQTKVEELG
jgi:1-acyl-sn-glycerol-3-phosphate acyltransferase